MQLDKFVERAIQDLRSSLTAGLPKGGRVKVDFDLRVTHNASHVMVVGGDFTKAADSASTLRFSVEIDVNPGPTEG